VDAFVCWNRNEQPTVKATLNIHEIAVWHRQQSAFAVLHDGLFAVMGFRPAGEGLELTNRSAGDSRDVTDLN
jgi:hypothetical protein